MITQRQFYKKTKKGSIIKVVNEIYLRNDIHCGILNCIICSDNNIDLPSDNIKILSDKPRLEINQIVELCHYIIPDHNVIINQIDVLEDDDFGEDIIILQSVLDEVKKKNLQIYLRIRQLIQVKKYYVFINLFNEYTYSAKKLGESNEEYQNRLIRIAADWYINHLKGKISIVLLTDYIPDKNTALNEKIFSCLISDYVKGLKKNVNLIEKLSYHEETTESIKEKFLYSEHLSLAEIHNRIKLNTVHQAKFQTTLYNYLEGTVIIKLNNDEIQLLIQGRENINRAIHEDIVAIEVLPESEWKAKSDLVVIAEENSKNEIKETSEDINLDSKKNVTEKIPTGKVVGIIKRNWRQYCGVLREKDLVKSMLLTGHYFVAAEKRIPFIRIETRQYETLKNQRIVVAIDSWPRDSKYPKGHYVRSLGMIGDKETENELVLLEHDIPYLDFTKKVLNCLPNPNTWKIPQEEYDVRLDLRDLNICSVDPPGCTDIDDALHFRELGNNEVEVGVHIADVSYFVKPDSPLDIEASNRGTTIYLVDKRINMIPECLSTNLCSLIENEERLTFSVILKMNKNTAEILDRKFNKTIIKSRKAFTYAEAQLRIDKKNLIDDITLSLRGLNNMAKILKKKRLDNGAIVLANVGDLRFVEIESETHDNVLQLETKQLKETNSMIEEFMLLANIEVAKKLYEEFPSLALLRKHPKPSISNFTDLQKSLKNLGYDVDFSTNKSFSSSLDSVQDKKNPFLNLMVRILTTRSMTQAQYFCSGTLANTDENYSHFGLATQMYTHFTSPIRRYADLVVHRLLSHAISYDCISATLISKDKMQKICDNINYRHRNAQYANRASIKLYTIWYIKKMENEIIEEGFILYIKKNALNIFIPKLALEIIYFLKPAVDWLSEENDLCLSQMHVPTRTILNRFDKVKVLISVVDKSTQIHRNVEKLEVKIIDPQIDVTE